MATALLLTLVVGAAVTNAGSGTVSSHPDIVTTSTSSASSVPRPLLVDMGNCGPGSLPATEGRSFHGIGVGIAGPSSTRVFVSEIYTMSLTASSELGTHIGATTLYLVKDGRVVAASPPSPSDRFATITPRLPDAVGAVLPLVSCPPAGAVPGRLTVGNYQVIGVVELDGQRVRTHPLPVTVSGPAPQPPGRTATLYGAGLPIDDCSRVDPFPATVSSEGELLPAALRALFAGVHPDASAHLRSFSGRTAGLLRSVHVRAGVAYVDLHADLFPGAATTSHGSCAFEAAVEATVVAASPATSVRYALDGEPSRYVAAMQGVCPEVPSRGDVCDEVAFRQ